MSETTSAIYGKQIKPKGVAPAIALLNPKYADNVAKVVRLASCFGLTEVWFSGDRVSLDPAGKQRLPREERMKGYQEVELRQHDYIFDQFPEATFVLAEPIELGSIPDEGTPISAVAIGDLTIHGVTQRVEFPLDAQIQSGSVVAAGQLQVALADYDINPPSARIVASVEDVAILELSLVFSRSGG